VVSVAEQHPPTGTRSGILAQRRLGNIVLHPDYSHVHYLTVYLSAVAGCLGQRGMVIRAAELTPTLQWRGCRITFDPPRQPGGSSAPAWMVYQASWDEHRGWCCRLHHIANDQSRIHRYLGEPLVPAPGAVADFIAGLSDLQTLRAPGPARPVTYRRRAPQELADDLIRFTPTCTWIG
jgi:hypothetical protein